MSKVRVYEVARDLGVENREVLQRIAALGIQVRNHMSVIDAADADRVKRALDRERNETIVEERIRPTVVRRRTARKKAPEPAPTPVAAVAIPPKPVAEERVPAATPVAAVAAPEPVAETAPAAQPEPEPAAEVADTTPEATPEPAAEPAVAEAAAPEAKPEEATAAESAEAAPVQEEAAPTEIETKAPEEAPKVRSSEPPPASERFAHANLPPGVIGRGATSAPGVSNLSAEARRRIVSEHAAKTRVPRRRELGRAALGPAGRKHGNRPGKKRMAPGKRGKQTEITVPSAQKRVIRIEGQIQLQQLAQRMSLKATDVLMKLMQLGMGGVHINSTLDSDTAKLIAQEFHYEVEDIARSEEELVGDARGEFEDLAEDREGRPPIVTVMGHVDHGKTSLLDRIRKADVAGGEAGGITQHIGAYKLEYNDRTMVFLDTPGHEAFTAMRARGAQATDIVILVVAADDGVMPQTREAINHSKAAGVPIVVAVNKCDRAEARPDQIRTELATEGLQPEEWGGDVMMVNCSAISGEGIDSLLGGVLLQAEMLELTANVNIPAAGVVLEAYLDRGRGPVANVLVRNGTLNAGDYMVVGSSWGRVRALTDERNRRLKAAGPATPVEVLGLNEMPSAGDLFYVVQNQRKAQEVAESRVKPQGPGGNKGPMSLDQLQKLMQSGDVKELKLVVKADVQGSIEALVKALTDLSTEQVKVNVIHTGVGGITENDVMLASASSAIILGFNVRPAGKAAATAKKQSVDIRPYKVIYEAVDEVKDAMAGLLAPKIVESDVGRAEVREVFTIPKVGAVAGTLVTSGKMQRGLRVRLVRDSVQVWEGDLASLRRFKDDVREVASGYECGIGLKGFNDVKTGDVIECFELTEVAATLE